MTATEERNDKETDEAKEERKEAALASTPSLQPDFKPSSVTEQQILKLQELHKRRLQIQAKSKIHKKAKGEITKSQSRKLSATTSDDRDEHKQSSPCNSDMKHKSSGSSTQVDNGVACRAPKRPQKLHWGLDVKERWERKANM